MRRKRSRCALLSSAVPGSTRVRGFRRFAARLVCAGLFYLAFSSFSNNSNAVAVEGNKNSIVSPVETEPSHSQQSNQSDNSTVVTGENIVKPSNSERLPQKVKNEAATAKNLSAVSERKFATNHQNVKPSKSSVAENGSKNVKPTIPVQPRKPARQTEAIDFSNRAEEDKSLRLSDLFDEVSMR